MAGGTEHFIFAGGGTGGHLFPGLAVAEELGCVPGGRRQAHVVSSNRAIDARVLAGRPVTVLAVPAQPFGVHPMRLWRCLSSWGSSVRAVRRLIAECRRDGGTVRMVATGGFVAAPAVQAARVDGVPLVVLNIDAVPGKANRFIAWRAGDAARVLTTFRLSEGFAQSWRVIPPIVRREALAPGDRTACKRKLGLDPQRPVLMVTGGSLGAASLSGLLPLLCGDADGPLRRQGWQVLHQTGKAESPLDVGSLRAMYAAAGVKAVVVEFNPALGQWWGAADLAVTRAGAGAVAEAWANTVPAVFVPYPYHKDQHQALNAKPLVELGGAVLMTDLIDPAKTLAAEQGRGDGMLGLLAEPARLEAMRQKLGKLGPADGAAQVAREVLAATAGGRR